MKKKPKTRGQNKNKDQLEVRYACRIEQVTDYSWDIPPTCTGTGTCTYSLGLTGPQSESVQFLGF